MGCGAYLGIGPMGFDPHPTPPLLAAVYDDPGADDHVRPLIKGSKSSPSKSSAQLIRQFDTFAWVPNPWD